MNNLDKQYFELLEDILSNGTQKGDRTGTGNISVFGRMIRHKMSEGFPLITTKKVYFKGVLVELLWFLKGGTNIKYMVENDCTIWVGDAYKKFQSVQNAIIGLKPPASDEALAKYIDWYENIKTKDDFIEKIKTDDQFAQRHGDLGPVYGKQWREWQGSIPSIDQIKDLIDKLKNNPEDRRMIVSAWNVQEIPLMTLPPCHYSFQCYARPLSSKERVNLWKVKHGMTESEELLYLY